MPSWFCGQNSQPKPDCHQRRIVRHEARGKRRLGFDRGAGALLARASPNRLTVASSYANDRSPLALPWCRLPRPVGALFGSKGAARGRVDGLVPVVPPDAIARRRVAAQDFLNDTRAGSTVG